VRVRVCVCVCVCVLGVVRQADDTLDWITSNAAARPLLANVIRGSNFGGPCAPSDHCPVVAIYEI
jgi:hypothetical protein